MAKSSIQLLCTKAKLTSKLKQTKAFVFDWDGVFTNGEKDFELQSRFNEIDSMGTNLLRFAYYFKYRHHPFTAIISGENNKAAFTFTKRECFHGNYFKISNKIDAARHFCLSHKISLNEIAFVFDDVLDLSIAEKCGIRIFIARDSAPMLTKYVIKNKLADIIVNGSVAQQPVRLLCEFLINLYGVYDEVISQRIKYSVTYDNYIRMRREINPQFFTLKDGHVMPANV